MWNRNVESECGRRIKGADIASRLETLAVAVLDLMPKLERHWASRHIARQLGRCATGGGSNYEEARSAESTADFVHKIGIAAKEIRETHYWLRLLRRTTYLADKSVVEPLLIEANELIAILTASARTAKARST